MLTVIKTIILEVVLLCTCLLGDYFVNNAFVEHKYVHAIIDNVTHGLVGAVAWAVVCQAKLTMGDILQCVTCLLMAMAVDVDHFLAARSFSLEAALSLPSRPPFHTTTLIPIVDIIIIVMFALFQNKSFLLIGMMFTVACATHHVRDATRHGLWFYPFGNTPPLSKSLYLWTILLLPFIIRFVYNIFIKHSLKERTLHKDIENARN